MDTSERQIKRIVLDRMDRCSVCHREYGPDDVHVLAKKPDMWMMVVRCTECHARSFVAAVLNDGDPDEARLALRQLTTEASSEVFHEAATEAVTGPPVSAIDVLNIHEFLEEFDGDFRSLFAS
ncbi:MAG: hypothetical protein ACRDJW_17000 [Thermomicrobiales bacterium]